MDEAEDVVHDALVVMLQTVSPVSIEYAMGIVRHLAYRYRRRRFVSMVLAEQVPQRASGAAAARRDALLDLVNQVRSTLPERAQAVAAKVMEGASIADMASALGLYRTQVYREVARIRSAIDGLLCHSNHLKFVGARHVDVDADMDSK